MGSKYEYNKNLFTDLFVEILLQNKTDITDKAVQIDIKNILINFAKSYVPEEELLNFDFEIKKRKHGIVVVASNFSSALFLSGIIPENFKSINNKKELEFKDNLYTFDPLKKKLKIIKKYVKN